MDSLQQLLQVMQALRDPIKGCPWDREQTSQSLIPYTLEETYEVVDAIESGDSEELKNELGDLLFQIVFYAQIASEQGQFDFADIADAIAGKLIRRHPHVFADEKISDAASQTIAWEQHKQQERQQKANAQGQLASHLDNVSRALPALTRAEKLQKRAARIGFDWPEIQGVFSKVEEELAELQAELVAETVESHRLQDELGDLLFSCVNLARHLGVNPESSLRQANQKFERRFRAMETSAHQSGSELAQLDVESMEQLWQQVKQGEA